MELFGVLLLSPLASLCVISCFGDRALCSTQREDNLTQNGGFKYSSQHRLPEGLLFHTSAAQHDCESLRIWEVQPVGPLQWSTRSVHTNWAAVMLCNALWVQMPAILPDFLTACMCAGLSQLFFLFFYWVYLHLFYRNKSIFTCPASFFCFYQ